jgi:rhodanese-related sulfurtransferase
MSDLQNTVKSAKDKAKDTLNSQAIPTPPEFHEQADVYELKSRLDWGEPALTILDVRSRQMFSQRRILGAVCMPLDELRHRTELSNVEANRDLYVYGANDAETGEAARVLRQSGYQRVAELKGGLQVWEQAGGSIEGTAVGEKPASAGEFNVVDRLREFAAEQQNAR